MDVNWVVTIVTVGLSILVSIITSYITTKIRLKVEKRVKRKAVLNAIYAEVDCLLNLITDRADMLNNIDRDKAALATLPLSQNYFSVYEKNAGDLSVLSSNELVKDIISTYMETKGLFDDVKGFSDHSMEIKKIIGNNGGNLAKDNSVFIQDQNMYLISIMDNRIPKVVSLLGGVKNKLQKEITGSN